MRVSADAFDRHQPIGLAPGPRRMLVITGLLAWRVMDHAVSTLASLRSAILTLRAAMRAVCQAIRSASRKATARPELLNGNGLGNSPALISSSMAVLRSPT